MREKKPESSRASPRNTSKRVSSLKEAIVHMGDQWLLLIVWSLLSQGETQGFNQLYRNLLPISSRTLSIKLQYLEQEGIVKRTVITGRPITVEYTLTARGKALKKPLSSLGTWWSSMQKGGDAQ